MFNNAFFEIGLVVVVGGVWLYFRARQVKAFDRQRRKAIKATAKLLRVDHSLYAKNSGEILANIAIEVHPPNGEPYALHDIEWYIQPAAASKFQEGLVFNIRIDASDPRVIFPAESWARIS